MISKLRGKNTFASVSMVSPFGIWIFAGEKEYYLRHSDFPWFKNASIEQVMNVKMLNKNHLFWPELDVDLHIELLENPSAYPPVASVNKLKQRPAKTRRAA